MREAILVLLCLTFGIYHASARTRLVAGGLSPDRTLEVVVSNPAAPAVMEDFPEEYDYSVVIRQVPSAKVLFESLNKWQTSFFAVGPDELHTRAFWSADSRFVVLAFESFSHTQLLRVFSVHDQSAEEVLLPDYVHSVSAALGVDGVKSLVAEPIEWTNHDLKILLSGTTEEPLAGTTDYDFNFSAILKLVTQKGSCSADISALQAQPDH